MVRSRRRSMSNSPASANASAIARNGWAVPNYLRQIQDRRSWHPEVIKISNHTFMQRARSLDGRTGPARLRFVAQTRRKAGGGMRKMGLQDGTRFPHFGVGFAEPRKVLICVRRNQRRQVMFAFNKAGRSGKQRRRRNNEFSQIRC